jgi:sugar (pentulose or hexulose) kinase
MTTTARTRRGNRYGLTVVGLLLTAGGATVLAVGLGLLGTARAHTALLTPAQTRYVHAHGWFWPAVAVVAGLVALICLRWLLVQTRRDRVGVLNLETDRRQGATRINSGVATDALEAEIATYPGVTHARARLTGSPIQPELAVTVAAERDADLAGLRTRIHDGAVAHLRAALEHDRLPTRLTLRLDSAAARRHLT